MTLTEEVTLTALQRYQIVVEPARRPVILDQIKSGNHSPDFVEEVERHFKHLDRIGEPPPWLALVVAGILIGPFVVIGSLIYLLGR